jgi:hypothetical protein
MVPPPGNHPGEVSAGPGAPTFPKDQPTTATKKIGDARTKVNGRKRVDPGRVPLLAESHAL